MEEWIKLNVGGQIFLTTKMTLMSEPDSMLAKMFSGELPPGAKDEQGAYMVDGTPEYFKLVMERISDYSHFRPVFDYFRAIRIQLLSI